MKRGFTLIETLIALAVLVIIVLGVVGALTIGIKIIGQSRARVGATSLVNKRMEMLRNLSYNDIGTVGGIPSGAILQEETIVLNGINYTLKTFIQYVDDPADGEGENDENGIVADYKRVRVEVNWSGKYTATPVVAVSDFVPKGIETSVGGGTLIINVLDASIQPVSQANVHIVNSEVDPPIDLNPGTNSQGRVIFPGSPSIGKYEITVTKDSHSSAQTYDDTVGNPNPDPGHLTILEGETTEATFFIDLTSDLTIRTVRPNEGEGEPPLGNVSFTMTGAKTIGQDDLSQPVYKYSQTHSTNQSGRLDISNLEWDIYDISSTRVGAQLYDISASLPPEPINIEPDTYDNILKLTLVLHANHTLLVTVKNAGGDLLIDASARLFRTGYDETIIAGESGQSFFTPLAQASDYSLRVIKAGYQDYSLDDIEVDGQSEITVIMAVP